MDMIRCSALLFDLDGVLIDSTPAVQRVWHQWALEHGFDPEAVVHRAHGRPSRTTIRELLPNSDIEREDHEVERREMEDLDGVVLLPGARRLLASLPPEGWTIATSCTRALAEVRLRAAGLPVALLTTAAFAVAGFCVAVTGVLVAGFAQNVNLQVAGTYTFDAIAAILVGGSAVTGGWGSVGRTVIGALIIATVTDMLLLVGASTGMQILVKGLIVTMVVVLLHLSRRERRSP